MVSRGKNVRPEVKPVAESAKALLKDHWDLGSPAVGSHLGPRKSNCK